MKVKIVVDYGDSSGDLVYVARCKDGTMESKLLDDEKDVLRELLDLIQPRCRVWKCVDDH